MKIEINKSADRKIVALVTEIGSLILSCKDGTDKAIIIFNDNAIQYHTLPWSDLTKNHERNKQTPLYEGDSITITF